MDTTYKRMENRIFSQINVRIAHEISGEYFDAILLNHSACGMYLEADHKFYSGTPLFIKTLLPFSRKNLGREFICNSGAGMISGKVSWCQNLRKLNAGGFGMGINCTSEYIDSDGLKVSVVSCDNCGEPFIVDPEKICSESLYVCKPCKGKIKKIPDGDLRENIENILMGNIF